MLVVTNWRPINNLDILKLIISATDKTLTQPIIQAGRAKDCPLI
jgi:hypothetical protein